MDGFLKLPRRLFDTPLWSQGRFSHAQAYIDLMQRASFHPTTVRLRDGQLHLQAGEVFCSTATLAAAWGWSKSGVAKYLIALEVSGFLQRVKRGRFVILHLRNPDDKLPMDGLLWDESPTAPQADGPAVSMPPGDAPVDCSKNQEKKEEKNSNLYSSSQNSKNGNSDPSTAADTDPGFARYVAEVMTSGRVLRYDHTLLETLRTEYEDRAKGMAECVNCAPPFHKPAR